MATDFFTHSFSDNYRIVRSKKLVTPADATYNLIRIPKFAFVVEVWLEKLTAYGDSGATIEVGFTGNSESPDPNGFIDSTLGNADATGMVRMTADGQPGSPGKYFNDAAGFITTTCDDNGGDVGTFWVFALYTVVH